MRWLPGFDHPPKGSKSGPTLVHPIFPNQSWIRVAPGKATPLAQRQHQHVEALGEEVKDVELVSGMLTAILGLMRQSFGNTRGDHLETMQVGELTVWLHEGAYAVLVGIIQGTPPPELRDVFARQNELIHQEFATLCT